MASPSTEHPKQDDRPWREIANELCQETNSDKLTDLAVELNRVLDKEDEKRHGGAAA